MATVNSTETPFSLAGICSRQVPAMGLNMKNIKFSQRSKCDFTHWEDGSGRAGVGG